MSTNNQSVHTIVWRTRVKISISHEIRGNLIFRCQANQYSKKRCCDAKAQLICIIHQDSAYLLWEASCVCLEPMGNASQGVPVEQKLFCLQPQKTKCCLFKKKKKNQPTQMLLSKMVNLLDYRQIRETVTSPKGQRCPRATYLIPFLSVCIRLSPNMDVLSFSSLNTVTQVQRQHCIYYLWKSFSLIMPLSYH